MKVAKWGNSLAVRLPAPVVEALELKEGDEIEIRVADRNSLTVEAAPSFRELLARARSKVDYSAMPRDFKFDREETNAR
ncbi:MAG: AbrB/MazE/SpoVT family DNA-binding domain-containing protein [Pseudoxanthomonas sp.]